MTPLNCRQAEAETVGKLAKTEANLNDDRSYRLLFDSDLPDSDTARTILMKTIRVIDMTCN